MPTGPAWSLRPRELPEQDLMAAPALKSCQPLPNQGPELRFQMQACKQGHFPRERKPGNPSALEGVCSSQRSQEGAA